MADVKKAPEAKEDEPKSARQLELEELRRTRVPAGRPRYNLDFPGREGYVRHVFGDKPGLLEQKYKEGWRFVKSDDLPGVEDKNIEGLLKPTTRQVTSGVVSQVIGTHKDRSAMMGYLMEIPTELYNEDRAREQERIDALEGTLMQGIGADGSTRPGNRPGEVGEDGRYVPAHTPIKIGRGR